MANTLDLLSNSHFLHLFFFFADRTPALIRGQCPQCKPIMEYQFHWPLTGLGIRMCDSFWPPRLLGAIYEKCFFLLESCIERVFYFCFCPLPSYCALNLVVWMSGAVGDILWPRGNKPEDMEDNDKKGLTCGYVFEHSNKPWSSLPWDFLLSKQ